MTVLIISAPPMAAMFFGGILGHFSAYNMFAGWARSRSDTSPGNAYASSASIRNDLPDIPPGLQYRAPSQMGDGQGEEVKSFEEARFAAGRESMSGNNYISKEELTFLDRYPEAIASTGAAGGAIPINEWMAAVDQGRELTPKELSGLAGSLAYSKDQVTAEQLNSTWAAVREARQRPDLTHDEHIWLTNAGWMLYQRGIVDGHYSVNDPLPKEMLEAGIGAMAFSGGGPNGIRPSAELPLTRAVPEVPVTARPNPRYVPLPGNRLPDGRPTIEGPGQFMLSTEKMRPRAAEYQQQITGQEPGTVYIVNGRKFDGYNRDSNTLLEAKGPGYAKFIDKQTGEFKPWFKGDQALLKQAEKQIEAAPGKSIEWHFAEKETADFVQNAFREKGLNIKVIYTPKTEIKK